MISFIHHQGPALLLPLRVQQRHPFRQASVPPSRATCSNFGSRLETPPPNLHHPRQAAQTTAKPAHAFLLHHHAYRIIHALQFIAGHIACPLLRLHSSKMGNNWPDFLPAASAAPAQGCHAQLLEPRSRISKNIQTNWQADARGLANRGELRLHVFIHHYRHRQQNALPRPRSAAPIPGRASAKLRSAVACPPETLGASQPRDKPTAGRRRVLFWA